MTDPEWKAGYGRLVCAFPPAPGMSAKVAAARARIYREALDRLAPAAWAYAVRMAINRERFFPTVAVLLDYADDYTPPARLALPGPRATDEEREARRAETRRGLELIRQRMAQVPPLPEWPSDQGKDDGTGRSADDERSRQADRR